MTTMWTNFVKFGNPTPDTGEWSRVTKDDIRYRVTIAQRLSLCVLSSDSLCWTVK